ncbi:MAG: hypothetical protein JXB23_06640 [Candidatus Aminicenantes bacterium]|nr:hypothetical protein [Candidatus Aminicenantes bacterium]
MTISISVIAVRTRPSLYSSKPPPLNRHATQTDYASLKLFDNDFGGTPVGRLSLSYIAIALLRKRKSIHKEKYG